MTKISKKSNKKSSDLKQAIQQGPELFIGLVGAIGTDLDLVYEILEDLLTDLDYECKRIKLSKLLLQIDKYKSLPKNPADKRYKAFMNAGDDFCEEMECNDALAVLSVGAVRTIRKSRTKDSMITIPRFAYIFHSLKRPDEVKTLRAIYGPAFILISVYSARKNRLKVLTEKICESYGSTNFQKYEVKAKKLLNRDEKDQGSESGQNVRDTFPLADFFISVNDRIKTKKELERFLKIFFLYPYATPRRDENSMYHAQAAALRSSSLSRQVGAVISNQDGDIISVGTNEVPKAGGGSYWPEDENDKRDFIIGYEISDKLKRNSIAEILGILIKEGWLSKKQASKKFEKLVDKSLLILKTSQVMNLIEFGRAEHAEMHAFLDAARRGVSVKDCTLFSTTYPCHNCARHIITTGIKRVVYIEPYPKSKAMILHDDAITENIDEQTCHKVRFEPFIGISPRRYIELFTFSKNDRIDKGRIKKWERNKTSSVPKFYITQPLYKYYVYQETEEIDLLNEKMRYKNIKFI